MKNVLMISIVTLALNQNVWAKHGEHDGDGHDDGNRTITCTDSATSKVVLQFSSNKLEDQVSTENYDLTVKLRGDDIAQLILLDKRSGDSVIAKRLEELLKVTLKSDEAQSPIIAESATHRGFAELKVTDPNSQDSVWVKSQSRRGVKYMDLTLTTDEFKDASINIYCEILR